MVPDMDFEALLVRGLMKKVVETDLRWHVDRVLRVGGGERRKERARHRQIHVTETEV